MKQNNCNINNICQLEGTVPIGKSVPDFRLSWESALRL